LYERGLLYLHIYSFDRKLTVVYYMDNKQTIQWNLSNPTHQGTRKMYRNVQDIGILRFYFSEQKYFGTINFCWMSQDDDIYSKRQSR
jgi:hypothetical protein